MIVSLNWLKKLTSIDGSIDEITNLIGERLVEIESVTELGSKYKDVIIAKVVVCSKLENSDHLNIVMIDDGGVRADVERNQDGLVQVVCGASNVREGMLIAWLPPGSTVPETFNQAEPFVLEARKLRGTVSNGMIASARELDLYDEHDGILEVDKSVTPGTKLADAYELNDYLLDIENKSLTHRPDTFGIIGFAREVAAIQGKSFKTPAKFLPDGVSWPEKQADEPIPKVTIDNPELSSRYQAVVLTNVDCKVKSPLETQTYLARIGVKPHSAVVDATNYLMMLTGQPLHAFDYDKLKKVNHGEIDIRVRAGRLGEKLVLIDGREIDLTENDIVIANGETAVALAGAMGGRETEVDSDTTRVLLESASFNLYNLRNTQMRHGIFSEAITRFTKGQPAELTAPVLAEVVNLLGLLTGAKLASDIADAYPVRQTIESVNVSVQAVNQTLGSDYSQAVMVNNLTNVGFEVDAEDDNLVVRPPYWRTDIHIPEDVIEEVGRINGYDNIQPSLPKRDFTAVKPSDFDWLRSEIRRALVRAGANEVLTYSFIHGDVLQKAGQKLEASYRITNSISPDLQYYRQSLTPSLLGLIHPNIKTGYDKLALFELNKVHNKDLQLTDENVPAEINMLSLVLASKKSQIGAPFYEAKKILEYMGQSLGLDLVTIPFETEPNYSVTAPFEWRRSAQVIDRVSGVFIGIIGEYKKSVATSFKLPDYVAGFELGPDHLLEATKKLKSTYTPLSRYPSTERDICFKVDQAINYAAITQAAAEALSGFELETSIEPVDIYKSDEETTKNITIRIKLTPHDHTMDGAETAVVTNKVIEAVSAATQAVVV